MKVFLLANFSVSTFWWWHPLPSFNSSAYFCGSSMALIFHRMTLMESSGTLVKEASYTRLCSTKNILTVNGQFPGPTIYAKKGETIIVDVYNRGKEKYHHSLMVPSISRNAQFNQGQKFSQKIILSFEEGTLWWHAHNDWTRATVHGAIIIYPKNGTKYPFPKPNAEIPIILGQWWKSDVNAVQMKVLQTGADPNASDSLLINGQPRLMLRKRNIANEDGTFKLTVDHGKTYLLRIINAALHEALFFSIAKHKMTVVGTDGSYTKPLTRDYITIYPGQTYDVLLEANQHPDHYYMAAKTYSIAPTARPNGTRFSASINNISFQFPTIDILQAYYYNISGVYGDKFPSVPQLVFDFTTDILPLEYQTPKNGTEFLCCWMGIGNFDKNRDPLRYNLVDPPLQSTISVPTKGWAAIRFKASNPGVWFMHCHVERHVTWGMGTAFIVKNGKHQEAQMLPSPSDMPPC
ncbi:putative laccase-16 [Vitis vinifera]|uniref:laccase n=1 Tax=Vitis vinifera TaxID=29760 RepID=A0A438CCD6_VITVI|nr:putative laccase-16 [Vitis vinifera]